MQVKLFEYENVKLIFDNEVLDFIVNKAMEYFDEKSHKVKIIGNSAKQIWNSATDK